MLTKQGDFTKQPNDFPDVPSPNMTPSDIRSIWQTPLDELKATHNDLVDDLTSNTGAGELGALDEDGTTLTSVQARLDKGTTNLKSHKEAIVLDHPDGSVTTAKIKDKNVTSVKIGDKEVKTTNLDDGSVNTLQLGTNSVTENKLANASVSRRTVQPGAIGTNELDPTILSQPIGAVGVQAKFETIDEQLAEKAKLSNVKTSNMYFKALSEIKNGISLNYFKAILKALKTKTIRVAFVGDSITEGLDQVTDDDKYANRFINDLTKALPDVTITWENFGLGGRGISQFVSDTYTATNPETGSSFWRSWSVVGKTWKDHVKDFNPDLVVFAFGMNDASTNILANQSEYSNLALTKSFFDSFTKIPDVIMVPTFLPTKDDNQGEVTWFTQSQEATIGVARATREFAKQNGYTNADINRIFTILRDGIDYDSSYGYLVDFTTAQLSGDTSRFTRNTNWIQANSGASLNSYIYVDKPFYNGDISFTVIARPVANNDGVAQMYYRGLPDRGGYLVQVVPTAGSYCKIDLYSFNGMGFNSSPQIKRTYNISSAVTVDTNIDVKIKVRGSRHTIYVNNIIVIDFYDYDRLSNGNVGICANGNTNPGTFLNFTCTYFDNIDTKEGLYTEDELLGVNYNNDPQSGNAINHLSGLGYLLVYDAVFNRIADKIGYLNLNLGTDIWHDATLLNGWTNYDPTNYGTASYYKDSNNIVHLRGLVKNGVPHNTVIFSLPIDYRPIKNSIHPVLTSSSSTDSIGRMNVNHNGDVLFGLSGGGTDWVSLLGISFSLD